MTGALGVVDSELHYATREMEFLSVSDESPRSPRPAGRVTGRRVVPKGKKAPVLGARPGPRGTVKHWRASHRLSVFPEPSPSADFLKMRPSDKSCSAWTRAVRLLHKTPDSRLKLRPDSRLKRKLRVLRKHMRAAFHMGGKRRSVEDVVPRRRRQPASEGALSLDTLKRHDETRKASLNLPPKLESDHRIWSMATTATLNGEVDFGTTELDELDDIPDVESEADSCASSEYAGSEWFDIWSSCPGGAPLRVTGDVRSKLKSSRWGLWHSRALKLESGILQYFRRDVVRSRSGVVKAWRIFNFHADMPEFSFDREKRTLKLRMADGKTIVFRPDGGPDYDAWKAAIVDNMRFAKVLNEADDRVEAMRAGNDNEYTVTKEDTPPMTFSGLLTKQASACRLLWQKRWMELEAGALVYSKSTADGPTSSVRTRVDFATTPVEFCSDSDAKILRLETPDRCFQFRCGEKTVGEFARWKIAFAAHIEYARSSAAQSNRVSNRSRWKTAFAAHIEDMTA